MSGVRAIKGIIAAMAALIVAMGAAIAIVWPIWYLATKNTVLFTAVCLVSAACAAAISIARGIKRRTRNIDGGHTPRNV